MKVKIFFGVCLLLVSVTAFAEVKTIDDRIINLEAGRMHIIFIDIWSVYGSNEPVESIENLPASYSSSVEYVWVQSGFNVLKSQLVEFQKAYPIATPLVLDDNFSLIRAYNLWQSPSHVVLENGEVLFSGDTSALLSYVEEGRANLAKTANRQLR